MKQYKVIIETLNKPNRNGRIYTEECIRKALEDPICQERLQTHSMFIEGDVFGDDIRPEVDISKVTGVADSLFIEDGYLKGLVTMFTDETLLTKSGAFNNEKEPIIRLCGNGYVNEKGEVEIESYSLDKLIQVQKD